METPEIYVALSSDLVHELELNGQLARLAAVARVERWEGPGNPTPVAVADALRPYRMLRTIEAPGTIDGGDVLAVGRRVYIGRSSRTNDHAIAQVRRLLAPFGYTVRDVVVTGCLHLKSAVTALDDGVLLINPDWIPTAPFGDVELVHVHPDEPAAANALRAGGSLIYPASFPRTAERLAGRGFLLSCIDASELAKAEGAVTCCSVILTGAE